MDMAAVFAVCRLQIRCLSIDLTNYERLRQQNIHSSGRGSNVAGSDAKMYVYKKLKYLANIDFPKVIFNTLRLLFLIFLGSLRTWRYFPSEFDCFFISITYPAGNSQPQGRHWNGGGVWIPTFIVRLWSSVCEYDEVELALVDWIPAQTPTEPDNRNRSGDMQIKKITRDTVYELWFDENTLPVPFGCWIWDGIVVWLIWFWVRIRRIVIIIRIFA
jgi:hypothetical protein